MRLNFKIKNKRTLKIFILALFCFLALIFYNIILKLYSNPKKVYQEEDYKFSKYYSELIRERDEIMRRIEYIEKHKNSSFNYEWLMLLMVNQVSIFQDEKTLDFLIKLSSDNKYKAYYWIYGLSRQGDKGIKTLRNILKIESARNMQKNIFLNGRFGNLSDVIEEQLHFIHDVDFALVNNMTINEFYQVLGATVEIFPEDYEGKNQKVLKYLGLTDEDGAKLYVRKQKDFLLPYPGSIIRRTTLTSILRLLESDNKNDRFVGACVMASYGLSIGVDELFDVVESDPVEAKSKFLVALYMLSKINIDNEKIIKRLIKIFEEKYKNIGGKDRKNESLYKKFKANILNSILKSKTKLGEEYIFNYLKTERNKELIDDFLYECHPELLLKASESSDIFKNSESFSFDLENAKKVLNKIKDNQADLLYLYRIYTKSNPYLMPSM